MTVVSSLRVTNIFLPGSGRTPRQPRHLSRHLSSPILIPHPRQGKRGHSLLVVAGLKMNQVHAPGDGRESSFHGH